MHRGFREQETGDIMESKVDNILEEKHLVETDSKETVSETTGTNPKVSESADMSKDTLDKKKHMEELVEMLNRARRAYEQEDREIMSNFEYDKLYDELLDLEKELGITMAQSPTVIV